ncbi:hypothetical protein GCM10011396_02800 [Undibacterium terreum]|uniref:Uncharacterized protein n=1 Tax=Undibacterium terreum TaxID=1224302 RepID=A0A916U3L8_9BURK|nr:hypothetical protein GCM10011396_02800 [Undibacterium terreum]
MLARKLITTSITLSSQLMGAHRLTISVTAVHSNTLDSISLNLCLRGLGMSIRLVHKAPIQTVIAVGKSA